MALAQIKINVILKFFFFFFGVPQPCASDLQVCAGDEVCCLCKLLFGAPELFGECCPVWPLLVPKVLVVGAVLEDMLWGVWACVTRAVWGVRQPKAVQVGAQTAVSSAQPKNHNLLFPWEFQHGVFWVVVFQLF